ncbi:MAG: hypothetical protein EBX41_04690 [Chitinophagia bacterium]|nr:hypothetical protein [Chitinophagia bacterium]
MDYLDKPPLLFWVNALSILLFGANNFAYKFPSLLMALATLYATYRLAKCYYNEATSRLAALFLATTQGMMLMTNDVRCDTMLMGWVTIAISQIAEWDIKKQPIRLIAGCIAIGLGMATKGPIALMIPVFCFAPHWAMQMRWQQFFRWEYIVGLVVIAIVLLPVSIGLYTQFDMHPDVLVNGTRGNSGLRFFYWSQSFGRITGESPWHNSAHFTFLFENMLWSFLPWIFVFVPALFIQYYHIIKSKFYIAAHEEAIAISGFTLGYLSLASSAYQLPHYIFVAFPLVAIICAKQWLAWIEGHSAERVTKVFRAINAVVATLLILLSGLLIIKIFPSGVGAIAIWVAGIVLLLALQFYLKTTAKVLWLPVVVMLIANVLLTNFIYTRLLEYQVGAVVGKFIKAKGIPQREFIAFQMQDPLDALDFYAGKRMSIADSLDSMVGKQYVLTMQSGMQYLNRHGYHTDSLLLEGEFFKVSELNIKFVNPATRSQAVSHYYLFKVSKQSR